MNRSLQFFKLLSFLGAASVVLCLIITIGGAFSNPTVIIKSKLENCFVEANRASIEITNDDISRFVQNWIVNRYEWQTLNEDQLIRNISPFTTNGLLSKIQEQFRTGAEKEFKDKAVSQYVSKNIRVDLTDNKVVATFDRILRVSGVPLIDPAQMSFTLVKGTKTKLNPLGIYVNGITEHKTN